MTLHPGTKVVTGMKKRHTTKRRLEAGGREEMGDEPRKARPRE